MWALANRSPFAAERGWVRDKDGAEVWVVAVMGTFEVGRDGLVSLAKDQEEVHVVPKYRGEPGQSSLLYESDLVHRKARTDVLLNGHAYAPRGEPTRSFMVGLKVSSVHKRLRVAGDRVYSPFGLVRSRPRPFTKMPLIYERAYGGVDAFARRAKKRAWEPRNPVGCGFATRAWHRGGRPAPNMEDPRASFRNRPVGFGPIPGSWAPRVDHAGTYDEDWERTRQPLLAADFDERFYQSAPEDQQVDFLKGGELIELVNLTPDGLLRFRLPRVSLGFETVFDGEENERHRCRLNTLILEPDLRRFMMVWHTHLPCHHKVLKLVTTKIQLKRRIHVSQSDRADGVWAGVGEPRGA